MEWVYCNKCTRKFDENTIYNLLECGHIICQRCESNAKEGYCAICSTRVKVVPISKSLDSATQLFFSPMETVIGQVIKIYNFQRMHNKLYVESIIKKYSFAKKQCIKFFNANKLLQQENHELQTKLKNLGVPLARYNTSTPFKTSDGLFDSRISDISSIRLTPGTAKRISLDGLNLDGSSMTLSFKKPSPEQTVPNRSSQRGPPVPVHKQPIMLNSPMPKLTLMSKLRKNFGNLSHGYPTK